jgi:mevalonate kinase
MAHNSGTFIVSAPGKVILFGEHAVVHGKHAIAAAVSLRNYLLVQDSPQNGSIVLDFPELQCKESWKIDDLPWPKSEVSQVPGTELDPKVVASIQPLIEGKSTFQQAAIFAFLYLYLTICHRDTPPKLYISRSMLPVGAGLGSSGSFSVCLSAAFLRLAGISGSKEQQINTINEHAFLGEKCIHGNPSGIDNTVSTRGGAVLFQRPSKLVPLHQFPPLRLLLTNTNVPRRTSELVAGVGMLKNEYPLIMGSILDAVDHIVLSAQEALTSGDLKKLSDLINLNHGLLISMGVSHPELELVGAAAQKLGLGNTKLTGAGGGGCAITLVTDSVDLNQRVTQFKEQLPGKEVFETLLGAPGVGYVDVEVSREEFYALSSESFESVGKWIYWSA